MNPKSDLPPPVSAVIAVYNGRTHVIEAIESVLAQTVPVTEIVIVDDGSSDDSVTVIQNYISTNGISEKFVNLVVQENAGQGSARNAGAHLARSPFIGFLDQDDTWTPTHVEKLVEVMGQEPSLGWAYTDFNEFDEQNRFIRRRFLAKHDYSPPPSSLFGFIDQDLMMLPSSALIRRSAFLEVGGFDPQFRGYEDDDLFIRLLLAGWDFAYLGESLLNYRIHPNNSSRNLTFQESRINFYRKYRELFDVESEYRSKFLDQHLAPRMISAAIQDAAIASKAHDEALRKLSSAFLGEIFRDTGFNAKQKLVFFASKNPILIRLAVHVRGWFWKPFAKKEKTF
jgi:glycosyltransferase involved in cell wall biosynthesis